MELKENQFRTKDEALLAAISPEYASPGFCPLIGEACHTDCVNYHPTRIVPTIVEQDSIFTLRKACCINFQFTGEV